MDDKFLSKYDKLSPSETEQILQYSSIYSVMTNEAGKACFEEIRTDLLSTILDTAADKPEDRENIFFILKALDLVESLLQHKSNEYHALSIATEKREQSTK